MSILRDNLPYTRKGMMQLASAIGVTTSQFWIDPTTSSLRLKTEPLPSRIPNLQTVDEVDEDE